MSNNVPVRLLVVDDEEINRRTLRRVLKEENYDLAEAPDAATALELIRKGPTPRLIITDVAMPHMDGVAFAAEVRKSHPGLPIIFVTGQLSTDKEVRIRNLRGHLMMKPWDVKDLLTQIRVMLS
ncbi:MAG: response regulator [Patescibacteria group bacterium]